MGKFYQGRYILSEYTRYKYLGDPDNITYRSSWERSFMNYLSKNPSIIAWGSEEVIISYRNPIKNKLSRYFMDFIVRLKNKEGVIKQILVEVKPYKQTQPPVLSKTQTGKNTQKRMLRFENELMTYAVNIAKWKATIEFCKKNELDFFFLTEDINNRKVTSNNFKLWHWSELLKEI